MISSTNWPTIDAVICSVEDERFEKAITALRGLSSLGLKSIIRITDALSMAEGYNRGAAVSDADWIIFCHDDVSIVELDVVAFKMVLEQADVFGPCGTKRLLGPNWYHANSDQLLGRIFHRNLDHSSSFDLHIFGSRKYNVSFAQALDGVLIGSRRDVWKNLKFDESIEGFTQYDIDYSYRAFLSKKKVVTLNNMVLFHDSHVNEFSDLKMQAWKHNQLKFCMKFNLLPFSGYEYVKHESIIYKELPIWNSFYESGSKEPKIVCLSKG